MAMHEEARRLHVQLFADCGFMTVLDARQFGRQCLTASALARRLAAGLAFQLALDGGQVHVNRFLEQRALLAAEHFAGLAIADALEVGQFVRQGRDLEILLGQLDLLLLDQRTHLRQHGGIDIGAGEFVEQIHGDAV